VAPHFGARLRALDFVADRVSILRFDSGPVELAAEDRVILATPAAIAARLVPRLVVPDVNSPILNAHFRCVPPPGSPLFVGVIGGAAEWIFRKPQVLSVTVSAAQRIIACPAEELGEMLWRDVAAAYEIAASPIPPARIVKERRATFLASPEQLLRRPAAATRWQNLLLAGDYTNTRLPATIEGAIASGFTAARCALLTEHGRSFPARLCRTRPSAGSGPKLAREQRPHLQ
jgi:hypothetical protein